MGGLIPGRPRIKGGQNPGGGGRGGKGCPILGGGPLPLNPGSPR